MRLHAFAIGHRIGTQAFHRMGGAMHHARRGGVYQLADALRAVLEQWRCIPLLAETIDAALAVVAAAGVAAGRAVVSTATGGASVGSAGTGGTVAGGAG